MAKKRHHGLDSDTFIGPQRWMVDQDYDHKLSDEEAKWLGEFNDEYYGRRIWKGDQESKEIWRRRNAVKRDMYGINPPEFGKDLSVLPGPEDLDGAKVPKYLNEEEYKLALAEFRACLDPYRNWSPKQDQRRFARARARLEAVSIREDEGF